MAFPDPRRVPQEIDLRRVAFVIGAAVTLLGLLVLVGGWLAGVEVLRSPVPGTSTMKVNTAIGLIGLGVAVVVLSWRRTTLALIPVGIALLVGAITLVEYATGTELGNFDNAIVEDPASPLANTPGRPGAITALAFVLLAVALALIATNTLVATALVVSGVAGVTAYLMILGYLMNVGVLLGPDDQWTQMAIHTALGIFLCGAAVPLLCPNEGYVRVVTADETGGRQARILLPIVLALGMLLALAVRLMNNFDIPEPIPSQIVTAIFIVLLIVSIVLVAAFSNRRERQRRRSDTISAAVDAALEGVLIVDMTGVIEEANRTICEMSGYSRAELIGNPIEMLIPERFRTMHPNDRQQFVREGIARRMRAGRNTIMLDALGMEIPVDVGLAFVELGGSSRAVIATVRDTSDLVRANKELEQFAYVASHDLRAPLRTVIGFTQLLSESLEDVGLDEDQRDYLSEVVTGAERMNALVEALLTYSRIGRNSTDREAVAVADQVERTLGDLSPQLDEVAGHVDVQIDAGVKWDVSPALVDSAISNVLANSIKYRSPERPLAVTISAARTGSVVALSITDNGSGIPPDGIERATAMFQRMTTTGDGIGIGLASVKRIAEAHNGTLHIRSDGESFTEVTLRIPDSARHDSGGST